MPSDEPRQPPEQFFARAEEVRLEEQREWFRKTTPGERVDAALNLSRLAAELRAGVVARER